MKALMYYKILYLILIIITLLFTSCIKTTSAKEVMEYQITDIIEDVVTDFNFNQLDNLMTNFSSSFYHNERDFDEEKHFWQSLLYQYTSVSIDSVSITLQSNNMVIASFDITFENSSTTQTYNEPSNEFGDLSYFIREDGKWKIIGKNEW